MPETDRLRLAALELIERLDVSAGDRALPEFQDLLHERVETPDEPQSLAAKFLLAIVAEWGVNLPQDPAVPSTLSREVLRFAVNERFPRAHGFEALSAGVHALGEEVEPPWLAARWPDRRYVGPARPVSWPPELSRLGARIPRVALAGRCIP